MKHNKNKKNNFTVNDKEKAIETNDNFTNKTVEKKRFKRAATPGSPVFVETAVFVDRDLYHHMRTNYPVDTERELVRFVLAMINAVSLYIVREEFLRIFNMNLNLYYY